MSSDPIPSPGKVQQLRNSGASKAKPALSEAETAAFSASLAHHSSIVSWFAFGFVNVFAIFNAGAFTACIAMMSTELGKSLFEKHPYLLGASFILFATALMCATALMIMIMAYSLKKYVHYRLILRGRKSKDEAYNISYLTFSAGLVSVPMVACTFVGAAFILCLMING